MGFDQASTHGLDNLRISPLRYFDRSDDACNRGGQAMKKLFVVLVVSSLIGIGAVAVYAQEGGSDNSPTPAAGQDATDQADTPDQAGDVDQLDAQNATD